MSFSLGHFPVELVSEVIKQATSITGRALDTKERNEIYKTACALALVSTTTRKLTMPHLLHTVILSSDNAVFLFLRALEMQKDFLISRSRLALDYTTHVRRFWSSKWYIPPMDDPSKDSVDYRQLRNILRGAQDVGFNFDSIHLLVEVLGLEDQYRPSYTPVAPWNPTKIMFGGSMARWNPLTSTSEGTAFLNGLTHLTILDPEDHQPQRIPSSSNNRPYKIPDWVQSIPFKHMHSLKDFVFTLQDCTGKNEALIAFYTLPTSGSSGTESAKDGGLKIQKWTISPHPFPDSNACVKRSPLAIHQTLVLETAFDRALN